MAPRFFLNNSIRCVTSSYGIAGMADGGHTSLIRMSTSLAAAIASITDAYGRYEKDILAQYLASLESGPGLAIFSRQHISQAWSEWLHGWSARNTQRSPSFSNDEEGFSGALPILKFHMIFVFM